MKQSLDVKLQSWYEKFKIKEIDEDTFARLLLPVARSLARRFLRNGQQEQVNDVASTAVVELMRTKPLADKALSVFTTIVKRRAIREFENDQKTYWKIGYETVETVPLQSVETKLSVDGEAEILRTIQLGEIKGQIAAMSAETQEAFRKYFSGEKRSLRENDLVFKAINKIRRALT